MMEAKKQLVLVGIRKKGEKGFTIKTIDKAEKTDARYQASQSQPITYKVAS